MRKGEEEGGFEESGNGGSENGGSENGGSKNGGAGSDFFTADLCNRDFTPDGVMSVFSLQDWERGPRCWPRRSQCSSLVGAALNDV